MPDVQDVFRMSTQEVKPDPGALRRQHTRQRRRSVGKKLGAFGVAASIVVVAVVVIVSTRWTETGSAPAGDPTSAPLSPPPPVTPADAVSEEVVSDFLAAYGAFDARRAMRLVGEDADLSGLIEQAPDDEEGLSLWLSFLEAQGFEHTITSCDAQTTAPDTDVVCAYDFHLIRSQEVDRGPFSGSVYSFTVRDGEIVRAELNWGIEQFSPQMWEPFAAWVAREHPDDVEVMYHDASQTNFRLTPASIRLWGLRSKQYVREVQGGNAE